MRSSYHYDTSMDNLTMCFTFQIKRKKYPVHSCWRYPNQLCFRKITARLCLEFQRKIISIKHECMNIVNKKSRLFLWSLRAAPEVNEKKSFVNGKSRWSITLDSHPTVRAAFCLWPVKRIYHILHLSSSEFQSQQCLTCETTVLSCLLAPSWTFSKAAIYLAQISNTCSNLEIGLFIVYRYWW